MRERIDWRTAPPLWKPALAGATDFDRPVILRFAGDDFMDELEERLAADEPDLSGFVAATETWEEQAAGLAADDGSGAPLKLFQPAHGRFYLVAAGLVCGKYGLPDKPVDTGAGESSFFVLRRLEPAADAEPVDPTSASTFDEFAWVANGAGPGWQAVAGDTVAGGEERLAVFPVTYRAGTRNRRLLAGLIPVSARETYEAGTNLPLPEGTQDPLAPLADERLANLEPIVVGLQALLAAALDAVVADTNTPTERFDELRLALFFALLDLDAYLEGLTAAEAQAVSGVLAGRTFHGDRTWRSAVTSAVGNRGDVVDGGEELPEPVDGLSVADFTAILTHLGVETVDEDGETVDPTKTTFFQAVVDAFGDLPAEEPAEDEVEAGRVAGAVYVVRCGYERPRCPPSQRLVLSRPSRAFELASFFDPDAPSRPIRIAMPVDTSPAGLRKFPKNVSVAISKQLRQQMKRVQDIKLSQLDDGEIDEPPPGIDFGMVCTLSIPIITICALILLMILVSLLNMVFWWLPLFKICRPKVG